MGGGCYKQTNKTPREFTTGRVMEAGVFQVQVSEEERRSLIVVLAVNSQGVYLWNGQGSLLPPGSLLMEESREFTD